MYIIKIIQRTKVIFSIVDRPSVLSLMADRALVILLLQRDPLTELFGLFCPREIYLSKQKKNNFSLYEGKRFKKNYSRVHLQQ